MAVYAIIPARGGSKGIPRKNMASLCGQPLLYWCLKAAMDCPQIDRVFVSTDDTEIAGLGRSMGAEVIERPTEISGDTASSEAALLHALDVLESQGEKMPETLIFIQATSPLLTSGDLNGAIARFQETNADTLFTGVPFTRFIWETTPGESARGVNHSPGHRPRRQEMGGQLLENGAAYILNTEGFRKHRHRFFGRIETYAMPEESAVEIDNPADLAVVTAFLQARQDGHCRSRLPDTIEAFVFDFDGVFTPNTVIIDSDGKEAVVCNRSDGKGISLLRECFGGPILILSSEKDAVVQRRADKLGIPCLHGVYDKKTTLTQWLAEKGIGPGGLVYMGNDVNDVDCMRMAGCAVAPADAHDAAKGVADIITKAKGGQGAVRELIDLALRNLKPGIYGGEESGA